METNRPIASARERQAPHDRGFTLIEILIAIVLVGLLSAVAVIGVSALTGKASRSSCDASADAARAGSAVYLVQTGVQPTTLQAMVDAGVLALADGLALDDAGTSVVGEGWTMTITPGPPPTFACADAGATTTTPTTLPGAPIVTSGPYLTAWVNSGVQLQLYVYDAGGASCPRSTDLFSETFEVRVTLAAFASGDTIEWTQLGGSAGTLAPGAATPWTVSQLDGSSPYWFTKVRGGSKVAFSTDASKDHLDLSVRATYSCDDQHGTITQRVKTWRQTLVPGQMSGTLDGAMTG